MPENDKKIAVVILNWNGLKLLQRFISNVVEHSSDLANVYVIDNSSTDQSCEWLKAKHPEVGLIELPSNYGYAGGYNRGLKSITEPYAVLLNSDVQVTPGWLKPLISRFEQDPKLAGVQAKIIDLNKPGYFEYAGASGGFMDKLCYPFCRGRIFETLEEDQGQYDEYMEVFWATGACLMLDVAKFREAGELNESLFAHMEEIDLCWRLQLYGYTLASEPASVVYHLGGGTLDKLSPRKTYLNFRNSLIIMFLNLPIGEAFLKIMGRLLLDGIAAIRFLFQGKFEHMVAILRAHFGFYARFNTLTRKKPGAAAKPFKQLKGVYPRSIVKAYFINNKERFSQLPKFW